jgi:hypothetical protein
MIHQQYAIQNAQSSKGIDKNFVIGFLVFLALGTATIYLLSRNNQENK